MSEHTHVGGGKRVTNDAVWRHIRVIFLAATLFFLVNIALGFENARIDGELPFWQLMTHLHAGALGWITLSVIGFTIWLFTGDREVSPAYERRVRLLGWGTIVAFTAYIASIAIAFSQGGGTWILLPIFGSASMLAIWVATVYALTQLRRVPVVTTPHVLLTSGLLVASLGTSMGVLLGLRHATSVGIQEVGAHAPVMVFYLFLVAAAIVEWVVVEDAGDWTRGGMAQAATLVIAGAIPPIAFLLGFEMLAPLMLVMLVLFLVLFLARVGRSAIVTNPLQGGVSAWVFFGTIWLIVTVFMFPAEIVLQPNPPAWILPVLAHIGFLGVSTNLMFAVLTVWTRHGRDVHPWAEPGAQWLLNLGLLTFIVLRIAVEIRLGAFVMGLGALLGVAVMLYRLTGEDTER